MKNIIALVMAAMMALSMVCVASAEGDGHKIGILAPVASHGWVAGVAYFAQQAAEDLGLDYTLLTCADAEEMSANLEQLVGLGVDAIVLWPQFPGLETAAELALSKGIIISNFDMIINVDEQYADKMYIVTGDNYGMGYEGARYIAEKLDGKGKVLVLCKPGAGNINDDRMQGFMDYLAENPSDIEIIGEHAITFVRANDESVMRDALTVYPEIDAVFSLDDGTSMGALQAIKESGRTDIKVITGGGGCQEYFRMMLDPDYADIWVSTATYYPSMIIEAIENAVAVLNGEEVKHLVVLPTTIVDRDNVEEHLDENTPY